MTVKIGLIGCGGITRAHLRGYLAIPEQATVAAVADVSEENARARAEEVSPAAVFHDYRQMLAEADIDAVDICLPHHLHAEAIVAAADAGKHILCEKPLCITTDEATTVAEAVRKAGITLMCAHNQLFLPAVARAREMISSGQLGRIYELRTTDSFLARSGGDRGWRAHLATSGGGELLDTGYHPTYLLLHLAGSRPVEVVGMLSTHRLTSSEGEDSAQVLVRFADGAVGSIVTGWAYQPAPGTEKFSIVAENGSLSATGTTLRYQPNGGELTTIELPEIDAFAAEIADFIRCVRDGARPLNTETEGIAVLQVILGAYRSVTEKKVISLTEG